MDSKLAKTIVLAQVASDSGKYIDDLYIRLKPNSSVVRAHNRKYREKDLLILSAICQINSAHPKDAHYYVTKDNNIRSYLVYFDIKLGNERIQVSFHCFDNRLKAYLGSKEPSHWDHKSSRRACVMLAQYANMTL